MGDRYSLDDLAYLRSYGGMGPFHMARDLGRTERSVRTACLRYGIPLGGWVGSYRNRFVTPEWLIECGEEVPTPNTDRTT